MRGGAALRLVVPVMYLRLGDSFDVLGTIEDSSVRAIITDPPYGLEFMGKEWDKLEPARVQSLECDDPEWEHRELDHLHKMQEWHRGWLAKCFRILVPGGIIKSFSATRTYHRMAAAMEAVGFEILGMEAWAYGSGFPKSHNVSKSIDKKLGTEGEVTSEKTWKQGGGTSSQLRMGEKTEVTIVTHKPGSPEAEKFQGYGTALKPAWEPFVIGRKPA